MILEGGVQTSIGSLHRSYFRKKSAVLSRIAMPLRDGVVGCEKGRAMIKYSVICDQAAMILK